MSFSVKGWCPGALRPMDSGDGLVVRVRVLNGRLMPDQLRAIAALSRACGNGLMDVTNRANLQLRGVSAQTHPDVLKGLAAMDLLDPDPEIEARRNVMLSPFDPVAGEGWQIAAEIARLLSLPDAPKLPGKFGFVVDGTPDAASLRDVDHDIYLRRDTGWKIFAQGCPVYADGGLAASGQPLGVARMAVDLARWFVETGGVKNGRGRMRDHIVSGVTLPPALAFRRADQITSVPPPVRVGRHDRSGSFFFGLPFGQITPDQLDALAALGPLRLTPWRMMIVEDVTDAPDIAGLITDPDDPLLRVIACTGAPRCPQGLADVRMIARDLAPVIPPNQSVHISGCAKGCATRQRTDVTIIAREDGRFSLQYGGLGEGPALPGLFAREELAEQIASSHPGDAFPDSATLRPPFPA